MRLQLQIFACAFGFCAVAAVSAAAEPAPLGQGLDLIVIVDRSESMRDREAAALALRVMLDIVARNGQAMRLHHRFGVIGFGSTASVEVPLTVVDPEELPRIRGVIDGLPADALGDTDFLAAFRAAAAIFQALPADAARRRAIVLLTDGVPYVRGVRMDNYLAELQRFAGGYFRAGNPSVDVLLLGPPSGQRYMALWRALSLGRMRTVRGDRTSLLVEVHRIATRLVGTSSAESLPSKADERVDLLVVPPYLDVVVLDIFHSSPAAIVKVFPPGALRPLQGGLDGVQSVEMGNVLSTLVVRRPIPGSWIVRKASAGSRVRILSQQFFPRGALVRPAVTDPIRQYDVVRVAYRVLDAGGRTLEELPNYKLALDLTLTKPDGHAEVLPVERRPDEAGSVFETVRDNDCALSGRYWTDVVVRSIDASGNRIEVFRDRWSGFSVVPAARVDCRVGVAEQRWIRGVITRVDCLGRDKRPIEASTFVRGSPARFFRPVLLHENAPVRAGLDLLYLGAGVFQGPLLGAGPNGIYRLQLVADRSRVRSSYNVRLTPEAVEFVRHSLAFRCWLLFLSAVALSALVIVLQRRNRKLSLRRRVSLRESTTR